MLPLMLLTSADVLGRDLFNKLVPGTTELSSLMLVHFILSGLAYTHQLKGHARVTILLDRLPAKVALFVNALTDHHVHADHGCPGLIDLKVGLGAEDSH